MPLIDELPPSTRPRGQWMARLPELASGSEAYIQLTPGWCSRSEEHTSELQSLMRISYAVFCLKKKNTNKNEKSKTHITIHIKHEHKSVLLHLVDQTIIVGLT